MSGVFSIKQYERWTALWTKIQLWWGYVTPVTIDNGWCPTNVKEILQRIHDIDDFDIDTNSDFLDQTISFSSSTDNESIADILKDPSNLQTFLGL